MTTMWQMGGNDKQLRKDVLDKEVSCIMDGLEQENIGFHSTTKNDV